MTVTNPEYAVKSKAGYPAFVASKCKNGQQIIDELTPEKAHLWHMGSALLGEVLELEGAAVLLHKAKHNHESVSYVEDFDKAIENIKEELGDCLFYVTGILNSLDQGQNHYVNTIGFVTTHSAFKEMLEQLFTQIKRKAIYNKDIDDAVIFDLAFQVQAQLSLYSDLTWNELKNVLNEPLEPDVISDYLENFSWSNDNEIIQNFTEICSKRSEVEQANMDKLSGRYKAGFSNQEAQDRADKAGE